LLSGIMTLIIYDKFMYKFHQKSSDLLSHSRI